MGSMPPPSKERLLRSIVNRDSNTAFGTPLCKNAGYAPVVPKQVTGLNGITFTF